MDDKNVMLGPVARQNPAGSVNRATGLERRMISDLIMAYVSFAGRLGNAAARYTGPVRDVLLAMQKMCGDAAARFAVI